MRAVRLAPVLLAFPPSPALALDPPDLAGKSIVIVQAHPDDERNMAPMLYEACRLGGAKCHFVVTSERNSAGCALAATFGKAPPVLDLGECGRIRQREMVTSAAYLGATLEFTDFESLFYAHDNKGLDRVLATWARQAGGDEQMVGRLSAILERHRPDLVFTLDPRHGSSCHPAHRAMALLAIRAASRLPADRQPQVWLEETTDIPTGLSKEQTAQLFDGGLFVWRGNSAPVATYDWQARLPDGTIARSVRDMILTIHASQNETPGKQMPALAPERQQFPLVRLQDIDPQEDQCSVLALNRPTWDIPGNKEAVMAKLRARVNAPR